MELLFLTTWIRNKWCAVFPDAAIKWCIYNDAGKGTLGPHLVGRLKIFFTEFQYKPSVKWRPQDFELSLYKLYQQYCNKLYQSAREKKNQN